MDRRAFLASITALPGLHDRQQDPVFKQKELPISVLISAQPGLDKIAERIDDVAQVGELYAYVMGTYEKMAQQGNVDASFEFLRMDDTVAYPIQVENYLAGRGARPQPLGIAHYHLSQEVAMRFPLLLSDATRGIPNMEAESRQQPFDDVVQQEIMWRVGVVHPESNIIFTFPECKTTAYQAFLMYAVGRTLGLSESADPMNIMNPKTTYTGRMDMGFNEQQVNELGRAAEHSTTTQQSRFSYQSRW